MSEFNDSQRAAIAAIDGPPPAQQGQQQKASNKQTSEGKAQEQGAPNSEASQMSADPFIEIDMGNGHKRQMTQSQILGLSSRYTALNQKHMQLKPVTDVIENYMRSNPNLTPAQLAQQLQQLAAGGQQNVQFGRGGVNDPDGDGTSNPGNGKQKAPPKSVSSDDFDRWETDNASALPPGYREMHQNMAQTQQAMQQMMQMMQRVLGQSSGQVDAARTAMQQSSQQQQQSLQATIGNNLDYVQQQLQLPTQSANDFMMFAQERGYNLEDFLDPELTFKVMQDFKNNMQSPEMARLRDIHARRTAYTTSGGTGTGMGGPAPQGDGGDFSEFAGRMVQSRQL